MAAEPLPAESELHWIRQCLSGITSSVHRDFPFCWSLLTSAPPQDTPFRTQCTNGHLGPSWHPRHPGELLLVPCSYNHYSRLVLVTADLRVRVAWPIGPRLTRICGLLEEFRNQTPDTGRLLTMLARLSCVDILNYDAGPGVSNHHEVF